MKFGNHDDPWADSDRPGEVAISQAVRDIVTGTVVPVEANAPQPSPAGFVEFIVFKLFTRQARVASIEVVNPAFAIVTLQGDELKNATWTPGDKIQIQLGGWVQRTYTPIDWDAATGRTRILVYLHADTPGTRWARSARAGDGCVLFGPRRSIDLERLSGPTLFIGDESSIGLALALQSSVAGIASTRFLFDFTAPLPSQQVLQQLLGTAQVDHCVRRDEPSGCEELESRMLAAIAEHRPEQFVLTGRSTTVKHLHRALKLQGVSRTQWQTKVYWAPGKTGLD